MNCKKFQKSMEKTEFEMITAQTETQGNPFMPGPPNRNRNNGGNTQGGAPKAR